MDNHLMIDIETLDNTPTSAVLSIGAAVFDPQAKKIIAQQEWFMSQLCGTVSLDTVRWWFDQKPEALSALVNGLRNSAIAFDMALRQLAHFAAQHSVKQVWSHGGSFDLPIIRHHSAHHDIKMPWKYWDERCTRTLYAIKGKPTVQREGTHHSAMDDAVHQAQCVMEVINR